VAVTDAQRWLSQLAASLDGARIPGGCDECAAYQTLEPVALGLVSIRVCHDPWCPFLRRLEQRRQQRRNR
jgi:hypothetical protein